MEKNHEFRTSSASTPLDVVAISGEPAIVINGLPDPSPDFLNDAADRQTETEGVAECSECFSHGEWLSGRKVVKKFGKKYYKGKVVNYDPETNWYMVMYEDGDSEELEWCDLQEIMLPLDIRSPLTKWLLKVTKVKREKHKKKTKEKKGEDRVFKPKRNTMKRKKKAESYCTAQKLCPGCK